MSYQFEDDSALEELLNQQLDRRKQQTSASSSKANRSSNRQTTSLGIKSPQSNTATAFPSAFRPSTASSLLHRQTTTTLEAAADELASSLPPTDSGGTAQRGKSLSNWLQGGSGAGSSSRQQRMTGEKVAAETAATSLNYRRRQRLDDDQDDDYDDEVAEGDLVNAPSTNREVPRAKFASATAASNTLASASDLDADVVDLDNLLSPSSLQKMSKQRLIQVILEEVAPRLNNLKRFATRESAREVNRLKQALQFERNRLEMIELRQEEQLKLERQKWQQINQQLESRLASGELQMSQLLESQRDHMSKLDEQYQRQLTKLTEMFDQRLQDEKRRFEEILKVRDEMHKLELEGKMNVNCDLMKLDTIQLEWRKTLEMTINQLSDHYKSVEALLDKQAIQVNESNSDLAKKAQRLCDQYDNYHQCNQRLVELANGFNQLMPRMAQVQVKSESVLEGADEKLGKLNDKLNDLIEKEKQLEEKKSDLMEMGNKMNEDKFKLALDSSRLSMKEERLDDLLGRNSAMELQLSNERKSLSELQTQIHLKRLALDERFADLREQNYALHLLRKRLTAQKEELLKDQIEFAEERKAFKSNRSQMDDESKRLNTLKVRVQRELDQLRRLQRSLVCSLCMSRLFDGTEADIKQVQRVGIGRQVQVDNDTVSQLNFQQLPGEMQLGGRTLGRLSVTIGKVDGEQKLDAQTMLDRERSGDNYANNDDELNLQRKQTELDKSQLAAESRYVEQLFGAELT